MRDEGTKKTMFGKNTNVFVRGFGFLFSLQVCVLGSCLNVY